METILSKPRNDSKAGEPVWELAKFFPAQGAWTEADYLELDRAGNKLVEFTGGFIEVLPMPTLAHQRIVKRLARELADFAEPDAGEVLFAPLPVKLGRGKWREPDIVFVFSNHLPNGDYPEHADLVMEVVSEGARSRERDYKRKRREYAAAGVREYWIVDPLEECITVLRLQRGRYVEHGVFDRGERAASALLPGFGVDVVAILRR